MSLHMHLEHYANDVTKRLKSGDLKQWGSYTYWDGQFREGSRIVSESQVKSDVYDYFKLEFKNNQ